MKNSKSIPYLVIGILFVLWNVLAFVIPTEKTASFWIAYGFTVVIFAAQVYLWKIASEQAQTPKSMFLKIPIVYVGAIFLIIQLIAFAIFMGFSMIPSWVAVAVCMAILCIGAICLITTKAAVDEVQRVEQTIKRKRFYLKELQIDVELMAKAQLDANVRQALLSLAEKIRFSDPMSSDCLCELESDIASAVAALKTSADQLGDIKKIELLLDERNAKCIVQKD